MNQLMDHVRALEGQPGPARGRRIQAWLRARGIACHWHRYATGANLVLPPAQRPYLAVSAHYDAVPGSPGANDNASAVAVLLGLVQAFRARPTQALGLGFFIFDEEEKGLRGSEAYVMQHGTRELRGLINLEMLGQGEHCALWPLRPDEPGQLWETFEAVCREQGVRSARFHRILSSADHESFRMMGLGECFTLTALSDGDLAATARYAQAQAWGADPQTLRQILGRAPLFRHYHRPSDRSEHLAEASLQQACRLVEACLRRLDQAEALTQAPPPPTD